MTYHNVHETNLWTYNQWKKVNQTVDFKYFVMKIIYITYVDWTKKLETADYWPN